MKTFIRIFIRYLIIIIFAFLFDCFYNEISYDVINNFIENILFALVLVCPHLVIFNQRLNKFLYIVFYLVFSLSLCIETIYYYLFDTTINSSLVYVILDSNYLEAKEFISFYININIALFIFMFFIIVMFNLFTLKLKYFVVKKI